MKWSPICLRSSIKAGGCRAQQNVLQSHGLKVINTLRLNPLRALTFEVYQIS